MNPDRHTNKEARREYMRRYMADRRGSQNKLKALTDADKAEIKRLYLQEKLGVDRIGPRFGRDGATIVYWLEKMGIPRRHQGRFHGRWSGSRQRSGSQISTLARATAEAAAFYQPTLITFLPESPRLEMEWRHVLAETQAERGAKWQAISWAHQ